MGKYKWNETEVIHTTEFRLGTGHQDTSSHSVVALVFNPSSMNKMKCQI